MAPSTTTPRTLLGSRLAISGLGEVAVSDGIVYFLTECCQASATGTSDGVACRSCYRALPDAMGWAGLASDPDLEESMALAIASLWGKRPVYAAATRNVARRVLEAL